MITAGGSARRRRSGVRAGQSRVSAERSGVETADGSVTSDGRRDPDRFEAEREPASEEAFLEDWEKVEASSEGRLVKAGGGGGGVRSGEMVSIAASAGEGGGSDRKACGSGEADVATAGASSVSVRVCPGAFRLDPAPLVSSSARPSPSASAAELLAVTVPELDPSPLVVADEFGRSDVDAPRDRARGVASGGG